MMSAASTLQIRPSALRVAATPSRTPTRRPAAFIVRANNPGDAVEKGVDKVKEVFQNIKDTQTENKKHQPKDEGKYVQVEVEESDARKADKKKMMDRQAGKTDSAASSPLQH